jgi:WhiB family redox-sensing transcriptional regulator
MIFAVAAERVVVTETSRGRHMQLPAWFEKVDEAPPIERGWLSVEALEELTALPAREQDDQAVLRLAWLRPNWQREGHCAGRADELDETFFGNDNGGRPTLGKRQMRNARETCRGCPVFERCLTFALVEDERYGIWGGTTGRERDRMRREIKAGTPVREVVEHVRGLQEGRAASS